MLNEWFKVAYAQQQEDARERELHATLRQLPVAELYKIAMCSSDGGSGLEWLEQYKGTPLFEQAMQLEQEGIQLTMADQQERTQDRVLSDQRDQIRMKKRMLDLQLVSLQQTEETGGVPEAAPPAPPAAAPPPAALAEAPVKTAGEKGPLTTGEKVLSFLAPFPGTYLGAKKGKEHSGEVFEGAVRGGAGATGGVLLGAKAGGEAAAALGAGPVGQGVGHIAGSVAGGLGGYKLLTRKYNKKEASAEVQQAVRLGQAMARADAEKIAEVQAMLETGVALGRAMAKEGFDPTALLGQAKGLAGKAVGAIGSYAKQNPGIAAAAIGGGVSGLANGLQKDENGERHLGKALGGAAVGAAGGGLGAHASQNIGQSVANGASIGAAAKNYAGHWGNLARGAAGQVRGAMLGG